MSSSFPKLAARFRRLRDELAQLSEDAKRKHVKGRSGMTKAQLLDVVGD